jgi:starch synthase
VAADIAGGICKSYLPDIVHAHDCQAALSCVYMKYGNERAQKTPSILTIHNIAFQGKFNGEIFGILQLPSEAYSMDGVEYYGDISFLKGGIAKANAITTVSPTYSREILQSEFGMGREGIIQAREAQTHGILNGIDDDIWNPETDPLIEKHYHSKSDVIKNINKKYLKESLSLLIKNL